MNKIILMGRLTADPEVRYGGPTNTAIASFRIAVDRRFKREGQPEADYFNCKAFGKTGEFIEKYVKKGVKVVLDGELQNNNYTNKEGKMVYSDQIVVNSIEFAESKKVAAANSGSGEISAPSGGDISEDFMSIPDGVEDELPWS